MDVMDRIEALLEESRVKQGEAREQSYRTLAKMFDLILDLNSISLAVDEAFGNPETVAGASPQESDQNVPS